MKVKPYLLMGWFHIYFPMGHLHTHSHGWEPWWFSFRSSWVVKGPFSSNLIFFRIMIPSGKALLRPCLLRKRYVFLFHWFSGFVLLNLLCWVAFFSILRFYFCGFIVLLIFAVSEIQFWFSRLKSCLGCLTNNVTYIYTVVNLNLLNNKTDDARTNKT